MGIVVHVAEVHVENPKEDAVKGVADKGVFVEASFAGTHDVAVFVCFFSKIKRKKSVPRVEVIEI